MKTYADALDDQLLFIALNEGMGVPLDDLDKDRQRDLGGFPLAPLLDGLKEADTYFVSAEFQALVASATESLPSEANLDQTCFPSDFGWISLSTPIQFPDLRQIDEQAARSLWGILGHRWDGTVSGMAWERFDDHCVVVPASSAGRALPGITLTLSELPTASRPTGLLVPWLTAFWLLLSQRNVSEEVDEPLPRAQRKRAERAGVRPAVRVIRLPRHVTNSSNEQHGVDYQVRWIVSGHWRNQPWGPESKRRRQQWIAPHLKGPDDKPLVTPAHRLFVAEAPPTA